MSTLDQHSFSHGPVLHLLIPIFLFVLATSVSEAQNKSGASSFATLSSKADAARDADRLDDAVTLYKKAVALRPSWAEGWWSLGTIEYDQNKYEEAARAFRKVTTLAPKNGTAYVMLGLSEFELGREDSSLRHLQKAEEMGFAKDPKLHQVALYHEGLLLQRKGRFESAQDTLEKLCLLGGEGDEAANALGMTMLRMTDKQPPPQGSVDADVVLRIGRAQCLVGQRKYDEARPDFAALVNEHPDYPNIHYAYGLFLLELRDLNTGVEQLKEEIKRNPGHVYARLRIAAAEYKTDSSTGIPYAEEAVKIRPDIPFGHYLLGLLLLEADQSARAIEQLEIAEKTYSQDPKLYLALGSAYSRAGRKQDAARARAAFARLNARTESSSSATNYGESHPGLERNKFDTPESPK